VEVTLFAAAPLSQNRDQNCDCAIGDTLQRLLRALISIKTGQNSLPGDWSATREKGRLELICRKGFLPCYLVLIEIQQVASWRSNLIYP
jgi:hypothetical protein